jgi:hypothetical protein
VHEGFCFYFVHCTRGGRDMTIEDVLLSLLLMTRRLEI